MKILMVFPDNIEKCNLFVHTLAEGLRDHGCNVDCSVEKFWDDEFDYDVVHIHWPEALFFGKTPTSLELTFLVRRLIEIKQKARLVFTRHNRIPHSKREIWLPVYNCIIMNCDLMIHLGKRSYDEMTGKPNTLICKHAIIPHHLYDNQYNTKLLSKDAARKILGIKPNRKVILCFGAFRHQEEREFIFKAIQKSAKKNTVILAPRWFNSQLQRPGIKQPKRLIQYYKTIIPLIANHIKFNGKFVSHDDLPVYFLASDFLLIQRLDTLNSGNITMAVQFDLPVLGPATGNIEEYLRFLDQLLFYPETLRSLVDMLNKINRLDSTNGLTYKYKEAIQTWSTEIIASKHIEYYNNIL